MPKGMRSSARRGGLAKIAPFALAGMTAAPLLLMVPAAQAQNATGNEPVAATVANEPSVTLDVRDAKLQNALTALGLDNVVIQSVPGHDFLTVTVKLTNRPLSQVMEAIAESAGAVLTKRDGIYYLRPRGTEDSKPVAATPAPAPIPVPVAAPVEGTRRSANLQWQKIKLSFMLPSDLKVLIDNPVMGQLILEGKGPNAIAPTPAPQVIQYRTPINFVNTQNAAPPAAPPPDAAQGTAGASAGRDSGDSAGARGQGVFSGGGGRGGFGGQGAFGGGGQGGFGQGGQPGAGAGGQGQNQSLRPQGIRNIISNDADNALLVQYEDVDDLNQLREIIRLLDVAPRQVLIRAEFVSVQLADEEAFGINWDFSPGANLDVTIPPAAGATPSIALAYASGNAVANLRAALRKRDTNVIQAPIISTTNNRQASINVSNQITVFQAQNIVTGNGQIISTQVPITFPAANTLSVTPHINGDNSISMVLAPQLSTVDQQGNGSVSQTFQQLFTTRRVQNGETMVLGGFINKQTSRQDERVPILSDLPLLGQLFRQRNRTVTGSETLVFITPQIIEDRAQGAIGTAGTSPAPTP